MIENIKEIALSLGNLLNKWRENKKFAGKWVGSQFKAEADVMAHDFLIQQLAKLTPTIPVVSEEGLNIVAAYPERYWLIDPIDGTASFINGFAGFVIEIAFIEKNFPIKAVVFAPALNTLYHAEKHLGAYCNNKQVTCLKNTLPLCIIDNTPTPSGITQYIKEKMNIEHYLESGSIALKICKVADGSADLFIKNVPIKNWDTAGAQLILEEAGGLLFDINGKKLKYDNTFSGNGIIACQSTLIAKEVMRYLSGYDNPSLRSLQDYS